MPACEVVFHADFESDRAQFDDAEWLRMLAYFKLLQEQGVALGHPHSSQIKGSKKKLRELRIQLNGDPIRVLYAFDPKRQAIILLAGDKSSGGKKWYEKAIPVAEQRLEDHLLATMPKKQKKGKK